LQSAPVAHEHVYAPPASGLQQHHATIELQLAVPVHKPDPWQFRVTLTASAVDAATMSTPQNEAH
jgi:hypothetical protein